MTRLLAFGYAASAIATALAWVAAARRRDHRPIAALLTLGLGADLARKALRTLVLSPAHARFGADPFTGAARIGAHVEQALFLAWPAALAAASLAVFSKRRPWPALALHAAAVAALAAAYPWSRGDVLRRAYLAAELAGLLVAFGCMLSWARRGERVGLPEVSLMSILAIELATLLGPWHGNAFTSWDIAQAMYATLYVALVLIQGVSQWLSTRPSSSR